MLGERIFRATPLMLPGAKEEEGKEDEEEKEEVEESGIVYKVQDLI